MNNELIVQGLMIAAIGMGLVFVVIIFLWGLMALLMRLTSGGDRPEAATPQPEITESSLAPEVEITERQRKAAAAAVAVGLAMTAWRQRGASAYDDKQMDRISPWQAFHRSRQVNPERRRG